MAYPNCLQTQILGIEILLENAAGKAVSKICSPVSYMHNLHLSNKKNTPIIVMVLLSEPVPQGIMKANDC